MHAAALRVELRLPAVQSLKEKRRRLKALTAALRKDFSVSVAEIDFQDVWQRSTIGIALVAPQHGQLVRVMHNVERYVRRRPDLEVLDVGVSFLEKPQ